MVGATHTHHGANRPTDTPPVQAAEQLALLRAMCREMETLMPQVEAIGGSVPWAAVPPIYRFFDLASMSMNEHIEREGASTGMVDLG